MKHFFQFSWLLLPFFISCKKSSVDGNIQTNADLAASLRLSQDTITISNNTFYLRADLSRDFMPQSPGDGEPLLCSNTLVEKDSSTIPSNVQMKQQYVINGNNIWASGYSETVRSQSFLLQGVVRNGPKWGPDIMVDVICEFHVGDSTVRIIARQQKITATY